MSQDVKRMLLEEKHPATLPGPAHTASPRNTPCSADNGDETCDLRGALDWSKRSPGTQPWSKYYDHDKLASSKGRHSILKSGGDIRFFKLVFTCVNVCNVMRGAMSCQGGKNA